jgi:hypothetical protein
MPEARENNMTSYGEYQMYYWLAGYQYSKVIWADSKWDAMRIIRESTQGINISGYLIPDDSSVHGTTGELVKGE